MKMRDDVVCTSPQMGAQQEAGKGENVGGEREEGERRGEEEEEGKREEGGKTQRLPWSGERLASPIKQLCQILERSAWPLWLSVEH